MKLLRKFQNGWFCKKCDKLTEHVKTASGIVCCECGSPLPGSISDVKAKQRDLPHKNISVNWRKAWERIKNLLRFK